MIQGAHTTHIAIAACALELTAATAEIQLLPAGPFRAQDGRPPDIAHWRIDASFARQLIDKAAARKSALVIDYEHQSLHADKSGQPAPAAGWFRTLEWREGKGLFATGVEWTARAKQMIEAREYRYISPVFRYNKNTGAVTELLMAAVTNTPGIDGMVGLDERAAARFQIDSNSEGEFMNKEILKLLGLKDEAGEDEVNKAVAALSAKANRLGETETELAALKAQAPEKPDPAKFVPVESVKALQTQLAALTTKINQTEIDTLIEGALKDGRLLTAMAPWARDLGKKDVAMLKAHLDAAAPIAALTGTQTGGKSRVAKDGELTADQVAMCRSMGLTPDDYQAALKAQAA